MSNHFVIRSLASLAAGVLLQSAEAHADTFEFVSYTPPSRWAVQSVQEGKAYVRAGRTGIITFYASRPDTSSVAEAFAAMWRMNVEPAVPGRTRAADFAGGQFRGRDGCAAGRFAGQRPHCIVGDGDGTGRSLGVLGVAKGGEALRELTAFFDTVTLTPPASARAASGRPRRAQLPSSGDGGSQPIIFTTGMSSLTRVSIRTRHHYKSARGGPSACRAIASHLRLPRAML